ncbi:MAG TPA: hypothetical protein VL486_11810 [Verrucomicrobiae bacterium]|nr:hypothetical protein [Verrucomicrobiae bacterium]
MDGWRNTVTLRPLIVLVMIASLCTLPVAVLGASAGGTHPDYAVDYVPSSALPPTRLPQANLAEGARSGRDEVVATPPTKPPTPEERRLEFEREYGIRHRSHLWFLSMLQSAKYGLDKMSFTAKETARRLEFTYDFGSPEGPGGMTQKPHYSVPLFGAFGHPQLKSVLTEHDPQTGTLFVGLKLTIPFGQGD